MIHTDFTDLSDSSVLRKRAEAVFHESTGPATNVPGPAKRDATLWADHEPAVRRIELELQNEELRASRSALEASRARYLDLYDLAPVGYFSLDLQGVVSRGNLKAASLLGLPRVALLKRLFSNFIFNEDRCHYAKLRNQLLVTRQPQDAELRMLDGCGIPFWVNLVTSFAESEDGAAVVRVVVTDIAERKRTESKLRQAASAFTHSGEGIMITTRDGTIVDVNDAFCRITGYGREEVLNQNSSLLKSGRHDSAFYRCMRTALAKFVLHYQPKVNMRSGQVIGADTLAAPPKGASGASNILAGD